MICYYDIVILGDIEALQLALDRDKGLKGKRAKKPQKRIRRSGKKNKRKKEKDLTPDRTTESLFEELLTQGIIKLHREVSLDDFKGEKSFANHDLRTKEKDPLPTLGTFKYMALKFISFKLIPIFNKLLRQIRVSLSLSLDIFAKKILSKICKKSAIVVQSRFPNRFYVKHLL